MLVTVGHENLRDGQRLEQKKGSKGGSTAPLIRRDGLGWPRLQLLKPLGNPSCQLNPVNAAVQSKPTSMVSENNPKTSNWGPLAVRLNLQPREISFAAAVEGALRT